MTTTYNVGSEGATTGNTDTTTLNGAIRTIDTTVPVGFVAGAYVINLTSDITLSSQLVGLNLPPDTSVTINGNGHTINGVSAYSGFFAYEGNVTIEDLTIADAAAFGGAGGTGGHGSTLNSEGGGGGGGGAGLGGGLFVAQDAAVTLIGVAFTADFRRRRSWRRF